MPPLVDGEPFLGRFDTYAADDGRLALVDVELDEHTLQRWLNDQGLQDTQRVSVVALRGKAATFNILDDRTRARWATLLRDTGVTRLALDCLRPVLDALGLDEHRQAGKLFLQSVRRALVSRPGSPRRWSCTTWATAPNAPAETLGCSTGPTPRGKLTRLKSDDDPTLDDPSGPRFLSAFGRDVNMPEAELTYDERTRHLTIAAAAGTRAQAKTRAKAEAILPDVLDAIRQHPGISTRGLRDECRGLARAIDVDTAAKLLREKGQIVIIQGAGSNQHTAVDTPVSRVSQRVPDTPDTRVPSCLSTRDTVYTPEAAVQNGTQTRVDTCVPGCPIHADDPRPGALSGRAEQAGGFMSASERLLAPAPGRLDDHGTTVSCRGPDRQLWTSEDRHDRAVAATVVPDGVPRPGRVRRPRRRGRPRTFGAWAGVDHGDRSRGPEGAMTEQEQPPRPPGIRHRAGVPGPVHPAPRVPAPRRPPVRGLRHRAAPRPSGPNPRPRRRPGKGSSANRSCTARPRRGERCSTTTAPPPPAT